MAQGTGENDEYCLPAHFGEGVWKYLSWIGSTSGPIEEEGGETNTTTQPEAAVELRLKYSHSFFRPDGLRVTGGAQVHIFFFLFFLVCFFRNGTEKCHICECDRQVSTVQFLSYMPE